MKSRITLTIDPVVVRRAKRIAHARKTSVSALIEQLVRTTPIADDPQVPFSQKWKGKFTLRTSAQPDPRLDALKKRYHLNE